MNSAFLLGKGDFSKMNNEHFVHVLNFSQAEVEQEPLNLSELKTVVSQEIEDLSLRRTNSIFSEDKSRGKGAYPCNNEAMLVQGDLPFNVL
eukprot:CAMPEP_0176414966 /NCGR_PEP_ID=MMETSP0127-20121128/5550_1 /TAXON_ID=938130 /ORGANISM="Platyophrya macrostoma, Strain WH" /LENGTH=90 /DNA_ID=CAMNT_0017794921 /DNA_START=200 /DNA_END=468 /DNA_ORIENTATION=-